MMGFRWRALATKSGWDSFRVLGLDQDPDPGPETQLHNRAVGGVTTVFTEAGTLVKEAGTLVKRPAPLSRGQPRHKEDSR